MLNSFIIQNLITHGRENNAMLGESYTQLHMRYRAKGSFYLTMHKILIKYRVQIAMKCKLNSSLMNVKLQMSLILNQLPNVWAMILLIWLSLEMDLSLVEPWQLVFGDF